MIWNLVFLCFLSYAKDNITNGKVKENEEVEVEEEEEEEGASV